MLLLKHCVKTLRTNLFKIYFLFNFAQTTKTHTKCAYRYVYIKRISEYTGVVRIISAFWSCHRFSTSVSPVISWQLMPILSNFLDQSSLRSEHRAFTGATETAVAAAKLSELLQLKTDFSKLLSTLKKNYTTILNLHTSY